MHGQANIIFLIYSLKKRGKIKLYCINFEICFNNLSTSTLFLLCNMNLYFDIAFSFLFGAAPQNRPWPPHS